MGIQRQQRTNLLRFFSKRTDDSPEIAPPGLVDEDAFDRQLTVERIRSERSGFSFTVIVFSIDDVAEPGDQEFAERTLASVISERTRYCDTKGWFGSKLAVILPYTSRDRAACLIEPLDSMFYERLHQDMPDTIRGLRLSFAVYEYPNDELKKGESARLDATGIATTGG